MTARGTCAVCGGTYAVRRDGTLRTHWENGTSHRCMGSGWAPAPPETVPGVR
ncbi:hypothetical protein BKA19_0800 [Blastococcus saxobsidens]|uniref:Uncharacterized protein n=1 Tax=Blastococcus saxobsidens TaxID=138336 RepID=A0A4Q7Y2T8_9ACTN|nr:hypothetical protein BKA19_0800 [Blastococcus saxobsidens]